MNLQDEIVSLELAQRLKELGVKNKSYFIWREVGLTTDRWFIDERGVNDPLDEYDDRWCIAYTPAELIEMLPPQCSFSKFTGGRSGTQMMGYKCRYDNEGKTISFTAFTLANACGQMLAHLIEIGLMKNANA